MSSKFKTLLDTASRLARQALDAAREPHSQDIAAAEARLQQCLSTQEAAAARILAVYESVRELELAARESQSAFVLEALESARQDLATAQQESENAEQSVNDARTLLDQACSPMHLEHAIHETLANLENVPAPERLQQVGEALLKVGECLRRAENSNPAIEQARKTVQEFESRNSKALQTVQQALRVFQHLQRARDTNPTEALSRAAEAAAAELDQARSAQSEIAQSLEQARTALARAQDSTPGGTVQLYTDLVGAISELQQALQLEEQERQQRMRQEQEEARQQRESHREPTADEVYPCTCTETTRCHNCYQRQNDMVTGQGFYAPERGYAD